MLVNEDRYFAINSFDFVYLITEGSIFIFYMGCAIILRCAPIGSYLFLLMFPTLMLAMNVFMNGVYGLTGYWFYFIIVFVYDVIFTTIVGRKMLIVLLVLICSFI